MPDERFQPRRILDTLVVHDVDFVLIGGMAGTARGSTYVTLDIDVAYERGHENLERLTAALTELHATLRGAPPDLPFQLDAQTLRARANFTFDTRFGALDILGDVPGAPPYEALRHGAGKPLDVDGTSIYVASLDHLIAMKEAAGRPRTSFRLLSTAPSRTSFARGRHSESPTLEHVGGNWPTTRGWRRRSAPKRTRL